MMRSMWLLVVLALGMVLPGQASAGDVHFSFGAFHGWDHCYAYGPRHAHWHFAYVPPPVYVYPPPVVRAPVTYVYPQYSAAPVAPPAATPPASSWANRTEARPNALPASSITIRNPATTGGPVAFVVDEKTEVSLSAGESHSLAEKGSYTVEFDRGGNFGTTKRTLGEGTYEFVVTARGWDLVSSRADATRTAVRPARNELPTVR